MSESFHDTAALSGSSSRNNSTSTPNAVRRMPPPPPEAAPRPPIALPPDVAPRPPIAPPPDVAPRPPIAPPPIAPPPIAPPPIAPPPISPPPIPSRPTQAQLQTPQPDRELQQAPGSPSVLKTPLQDIPQTGFQEQLNQVIYSDREHALLQDIFNFIVTKHPMYAFFFLSSFFLLVQRKRLPTICSTRVLLEFFNKCENKNQWEDLADSLMTMTFSKSTTLTYLTFSNYLTEQKRFIRFFANEEFHTYAGTDPGALFRENSIASKIIKAYLREHILAVIAKVE